MNRSFVAILLERWNGRKAASRSDLMRILALVGLSILLGGCGTAVNLKPANSTTGSSQPAASLSPGSLGFGSQTMGTTSAPQSVTLTNSGSAALSITSIVPSGANSGDFAESNTCGSSLNAGASCTVTVTFTPTAAGSRTASVSVTDNASGSPQSVSLSGTGVSSSGGPAVTLAPGSLSFGSQNVGTSSAAQVVTLTNSGGATLSLTSIAVTGTDSADFTETNTCGASLNSGASCTISVIFAPNATGALSASVSITDNASGSPQTDSLSGTGTSAGASGACTGTPFSGVPVDITSLMSAPPAAGATVHMLTGWDGSAPTNTPNYPTNSDVIIHSPLLNILMFNHNGSQGIIGAIGNTDGTNQQVAATHGGLHVRPSPEGSGFVQPGGGPLGTDPQWTDLTQSGSCQTVSLANKGYVNLATNNGVPTTLPIIDPTFNNLHLVTWAPDGFLHRVYTDGTFICDGGQPSCPGINPPDGMASSLGFHRLRENYKFPHWIHYTRSSDSIARIWLYNFDTNQICYIPGGNHDDNSYDGTMYAAQDPGLGQFFVYKIFDTSGNLLSNVSCSGATAISITGNSPGWSVNVGNLPNNLAGSPQMTADFCVFNSDDTYLLCTSGSVAFPGHQTTEYDMYTLTPDTSFASIPTSSTLAFLTATDSHQTAAYEGIAVPIAGWKDSNGLTHAYFRSDKMWVDIGRTISFTFNPSGSAEVFEVTFTK